MGVLEDTAGPRLKACRHVFGAEPHNAEVLRFAVTRAGPLLAAVQAEVTAKLPLARRINQKRMLRQAARATQDRGAGTRAQQALQADLESRKRERRVISRQEREALAERKREIARQKAKAKHCGR